MAVMKRKKQPKVAESSSEESEDEIMDSDEELQKAFASGQLPSGTYKEITPRERITNDINGLETKLESFSKVSELQWLERLDITAAHQPEDEDEDDDDDETNVHDDFKRELLFYRQAEKAVLQAIPKFHRLGIPTKRPDDYFAQMIKSDDHMRRVREKLLSKSLSAEKSEKAKKMRELKKMGKKVQVEVLKSRQKDKREMLEQVKKYRKGQQDKLDFLEGDKQQPAKGKLMGKRPQQNASKDPRFKDPRSNKKREWKNKKFGFGGQKKRSKGNTKESTSDSRDYSISKNSKGAKRGGAKAKPGNKRPGKSKRQQMKGQH